MLYLGISMVSVAVIAVVGVVFFGDRLGFSNENTPEPAPLLGTRSPEETPDDGGATAETPENPEESAERDGPEGETGGEVAPEPEGETFEQEFITRYYAAVSDEDWATTYSFLDSSSQAEFTESEWVAVQEARVAETNPSPLESATLQDLSGEGAGFVGEVLLSYTDGSSEVVPVQTVYEDDGLKRYLTAEDVDYLRGLTGETSSDGSNSGMAEAVEQFVYEYYAAVEAEDWSATYAMLDYGGQAAFTESEWIERQEARQAASGAPSSVLDVSVSMPDSYPPVATVTVTFADGDVADITVADPHSPDAEYDRVLTEEEIAYLRSL